MLPTPDTSHVPFDRVYEPAEDSYLLLDTLSSPSETAFLTSRFGGGGGGGGGGTTAVPLVLEIGTGSGVVIAFVAAHARRLFGTGDVLTAGLDINGFACRATNGTVERSRRDNPDTRAAAWLGAAAADLASPLRRGVVDVLVFNPPYVPSAELPAQSSETLMTTTTTMTTMAEDGHGEKGKGTREMARKTTFDEDSYLLSLSYAGGRDGMETTDRLIETLPDVLSARGCAYILLCAQNKPSEVKSRIEGLSDGWRAVTVGESGKQAGWEKLQIIRVWRELQQAPS